MISSQRILSLCAVLTLAACDCGVNPSVDPMSIVVEPATLTLTAGGERGTLTAHRVNGEDVTAVVTWRSGNETLASVEGGQVAGLSQGIVVITAVLDNFVGTADVDVGAAPATCSDGLRNADESDVDCGGACAPCAVGLLCDGNADCTSNRCVSGVCQRAPTCTDGERNGTEAGVDCGGHGCPACGVGETCSGNLDCASRVCVGGICLAPTCVDGALNGTETALDCGGPSCPGCLPGGACTVGADCASSICVDGVCQAATCFDGVRNGAETGQDCGGPNCVTCGTGGGCLTPADCTEGVCTNGVCLPASCTDGVLNGDESDLDCGGSCAACGTGGGCNTGADCASGVCDSNICLAPTCTDGRRNGQETGLDCGGPTCGPCTSGQTCASGSDCLSGVCTGGVCQSPTCTDGVRNAVETGVDCGGPVCGNCGVGQGCTIAGDCASGVCTAGICQAATCTDGVANGVETDVDCGGGSCPVCPNGGGCTVAGDCGSGVCSNGVCVIPTCVDGVKNGDETALDCGGSDCAPCGTGQGCWLASDCVSSVCTGGVCQAATCSDGVKNGVETATDCGGGTCPGCGAGLTCSVNGDCASGNCASGSCGPAIVIGMVVLPGTANVPLGRTQSFTASAQMSDGTSVDVTALATWSSTDTNVGAISSLGVLQSATQGTTTVQAIYSGVSSNNVAVTVGAPVVDRIEVTPAGVRLPIGLVQAYQATGTFSDGSTGDITGLVTWSTGSASVASVAAGGLATAVGAGTTDVIASIGGVSGASSLEVTDVYVTSLAVSPATNTLPVGVIAAYTATVLLSDGSARDVTNDVSWTSTSPGVAQVSVVSPSRGLVTAISPGSTNITATLPTSSAVGVLTVLNLTLSTIQVFPADETIPRGFTLQYGAVGLYSDGNAYDLTLSATWSSSAPSVASVSNTFLDQGVVRTLAVGTTEIRASFGGQLGATSLRVNDARVVSISVTPPLLTLPTSAPHQYTATGVFDDGTARDITQLVRWQTSDPAVATISNATTSCGLLTSVGAGDTVVSATLDTRVGTGQLHVTSATLEGISISPPMPRIGLQGVVPFVAIAIYSDGTAIDVTELSGWSSSDGTVALVRNDTGYRGVALGLLPGAVTIRARFAGTSATAQLTVTAATLTTLYIAPAVVRTGIGIHVQFNVSGYWSDGTTADVTRVATWTSSLSSVAVISNVAGSNGLATTRGQGVTTIRATWAGAEDNTTLTVTNATLSSIAVTPATSLTGMGVEVQFHAMATFSDGTRFDVTTIAAWSSSSPAVASISGAEGSVALATAIGGGVTTITARMGSVSGTATLTVSSAALTGITVTPATGIIPVYYWRPYTATAVFADGLAVDVTSQATWTTSQPTVAHAGNGSLYGGRVTGLSPGTSSVLARFGGLGGTASATVMLLNLTNVEVTPQDPNSPLGVPVQLTATGTFSDGTTTIELDITLQVGWKVSPKKNGTVSNTDGSRGVVTMYNGNASAVIHAQSPQPNTTAGDAHTKVNSP